MGYLSVVNRRTIGRALVLLGLLSVIGCGAPEARFISNRVYINKQERASKSDLSEEQIQDLADVMQALFGTPNVPHVPTYSEAKLLSALDTDDLAMAAGSTRIVKQGTAVGLYREHCVHCHGITGDGLGPTAAFLNPYPRDYRMGVFKFKSTPKGEKPTHGDLRQVLVEGIPGTAMPSFRVLANDEIDALVHYVKYLAIRGEIERRLVDLMVNDLEKNERLVELSNADKSKDQLSAIREITTRVAEKWRNAEQLATEIDERAPGWDKPEVMQASINRGKEIFYGPIANCVKCHGDSALGDGQLTDFDDWTKELEPANKEKADALVEYRKLGALEPRNIRPRNLRQGIYRGGRRPVDLYWRIHNGIDGTPMPAAPMKADDAPAEQKALTKADLWSLIDYVRSLPYENLSHPETNTPTFAKDRL